MDLADVVGELLEDRGLRPGADDLLHDLAVLVDVHRRDAGHPVAGRDRGVLVDVHLDDLELVTVLRLDLGQDRGDLAARSAPLGPEVDEHRLVGLEDLHLEVGVGDCLHVGHRSCSIRWFVCVPSEHHGTDGCSDAREAPSNSAQPTVIPSGAECPWTPAIWSSSARWRSASRAAAQPVPAAVTACRYSWSTRSPQAKTPSRFVLVEGWSTSA